MITAREATSAGLLEPTPIQPEAIKVVDTIKPNDIVNSLNDPDIIKVMLILAGSNMSYENTFTAKSSWFQALPRPAEGHTCHSIVRFEQKADEKANLSTTSNDDVEPNVLQESSSIEGDATSTSSQACDENEDNDCDDNAEKAEVKDKPKHAFSSNRFGKNQSQQWFEMYHELAKYCQKNGHCMVKPTSNPILTKWIKRQRYQYRCKEDGRHSTLSADRIEALNRINFIWDSHQESWEKCFLELKRFKAKHGNCLVPSGFSENHKLSIWVKSQRRLFHRSLVSGRPISKAAKERVARLSKIGFVWSLRKRK